MKMLSTTSMLMSMASTMLAMAFYTLMERKLIGYMQFRKGPNKPNIMALAIPMADATKLFLKEGANTMNNNKKYYLLAPMTMIILALLMWPIFPHYGQLFFIKFGLLYFLSITSVSIYTTFIAGWSSNSSWALLGALRGVAQTISYEVSMALIMICFILLPSTMNLLILIRDTYSWATLLLMPMALSWMISMLAETHRTPFDFTEGESELVSGFNIEYSSAPFALIFMAEYMNILLIGLLSASLLTKNYSSTELIMKGTLVSTIFVWSRSALPRLRYDILMTMLWKKILPMSLMWVLMMYPLMLVTK